MKRLILAVNQPYFLKLYWRNACFFSLNTLTLRYETDAPSQLLGDWAS